MKTLMKTERTAAEGSVGQSGAKPVYECDKCGALVVWAKSARTEKWYLADVMTGSSGSLYYVGAAVHFKTCQSRLQRRQEDAERERWIAESDLRDFLFAVKVIRQGLIDGLEVRLPEWWKAEYLAD
jgi:hypothetical protein